MEVDSDSEVLGKIASGGAVEEGSWPGLRAEILARLDKIAHSVFPIPDLPPPVSQARLLSPLPSSPLEHSSQEANKENAPDDKAPADAPRPLAPGELPKQIADLLDGIKAHLATFATHAPHTIQRLAELTLQPRAHYKALASYLHAVDRVVQVTSGTNAYPLPPAVPDMSAMNVNGEDGKDPAATVAWSNPTTSPLGSDEALGGALLTPIPWLTRRSPERSPESSGGTPGAQIHSEGTETIDGPNGMGSIETVSVSVNGVPSTGHARGVTQEASSDEDRAMDDGEDETPHARGPEEIGVGDTGPQGATTSYVGEDGVDMHAIDVEAAVGRRRHEMEAPPSLDAEPRAHDPPTTRSPGAKREAEHDMQAETPKKAREGDGPGEARAAAPPPAVEAQTSEEGDEKAADNAADKMEEAP